MPKQLKTTDDIKQLGTILSVWAHPDDESWTAAGIMATAIENGQKVVCITATKGEQGIQDESRWPAAKLGEIRASELRAALDILGIKDHHWLGFADGGCKDAPTDEAVAQIKKYIDKYKPDTILTFGPEGFTGHDDHATVSKWVDEAVKDTKISVYQAVQPREEYEKMLEADEKFNIFFNIDKPPLVEANECDLLFRLDVELLDKKFRCLNAMPSQTEAMFKHFGKDFICNMICSEAFVKAKAVDPWAPADRLGKPLLSADQSK